ncbi:MAG: hypothetical protein GXP49_05040 [Deltaproteobacteria bacterium]|nr:hypothetical protein [Deltaproteobacteria bacterium]
MPVVKNAGVVSLAMCMAFIFSACLSQGEPYSHDNPYDPAFGTFFLFCNTDDQGVHLGWTMPPYMSEGDSFVVFVDDELDHDFKEMAELNWQNREYLDARPLGQGEARDYLIGVRREGEPVPGTSNWVHCIRK